LSYSQSDASPAVGPARRLVVFNGAVNYDGIRKHTFLEAIVDTVWVNT
jgi:hypothetical protein